MEIVKNQHGGSELHALETIRGQLKPSKSRIKQQNKTQEPEFVKLFNQAVERQYQLHFSRHVQDRFQQRQIFLNGKQLEEIHQAVQLAQQKGIRDSLIVTKDSAFIVNIPSKTVITAMERDATRFRVFNNIDGAVITT
ncbi:MAG: TIGR02530 family flagellar biosynthesis protein [candidate division KSB1 bacterium]|nr:TIGR02530 family flagellar biosynthesis protein [candidate division KSB1 bacterium]